MTRLISHGLKAEREFQLYQESEDRVSLCFDIIGREIGQSQTYRTKGMIALSTMQMRQLHSQLGVLLATRKEM